MSNINENRINFVFPVADITAMNASLASVLAKMPANSALSTDQRDSYTAIDVANRVFCQECYSESSATGAGIVSSYINLTSLNNDLTLNQQMLNLSGIVSSISQRIDDILRVTGHEAFKVSNLIYEDYQKGARVGIDNAQAGYERLKVRYDAQGPGRSDETEV